MTYFLVTTNHIRGLFKKYHEFWITLSYVFSIFCHVLLVLIFLTHVDKFDHFEWSVNFCHLFCLAVFWLVFDFWIKEYVSDFVWKTKLSAWTHSECWLWHTVKLPWTKANVYRWYKMCSEGREDVNEGERAGRPSISTTEKKHWLSEENSFDQSSNPIREVAEDLNTSIGSCYSIFTNNLGMRRVAAKFVSKLLNFDQKQHRINTAKELLDSVRKDLLQRVITGDESWIYGYDVKTNAQSSQWKLRPKKARQVRSNVKVLLKAFFDYREVVHEFLPQGSTVNNEYYLQVMGNVR